MAKHLYYLTDRDISELQAALRLLRSGSLLGQRRSLGVGRNNFLCKITSAGPNAEADFTDARYWLREVVITNNDGDYTSELSFDYPPAGEGRWLAATHLAELAAATHSLPTDDTILVVCYINQDKASLGRYYFNITSAGTFLRPGKITEVIADAGPPSAHRYKGIYVDDGLETTWKTASGSEASLGTICGQDQNIVYHPLEVDGYVTVVLAYLNIGTEQTPIYVAQPVGLDTSEAIYPIVCT